MNKEPPYIRGIDPIGRIVIPRPIREKLGLTGYEMFEVYLEGDRIGLRKITKVEQERYGFADDVNDDSSRAIAQRLVDRISKGDMYHMVEDHFHE